jgi:DnaJ-class molecular chaperone
MVCRKCKGLGMVKVVVYSYLIKRDQYKSLEKLCPKCQGKGETL